MEAEAAPVLRGAEGQGDSGWHGLQTAVHQTCEHLQVTNARLQPQHLTAGEGQIAGEEEQRGMRGKTPRLSVRSENEHSEVQCTDAAIHKLWPKHLQILLTLGS